MSLKKIGNLSSSFKAKDTQSVISALKDFGDLKQAGEWIGRISNDGKGKSVFTDEKLVEMFKSAYGKNTKEEDILSAIGNGLEKSSTIMGTGFSLKGIGDSLKNTGSGLLKFIKPFAPLLIGTMLAGVGYAGFKFLDNQFNLTKATTSKKYQKAQEEHENAQSDLKAAKSEYDSNQDRIYELRAKENRSLDESQELNNLQDQNELLGAQVSLKEKIEKQKRIAEADSALTDLNKRYNQKDYLGVNSEVK